MVHKVPIDYKDCHMTSMVITYINVKSRVGGNCTRWGIRTEIFLRSIKPVLLIRNTHFLFQSETANIPFWKTWPYFGLHIFDVMFWFLNFVSLQSSSLSIHIFVKPEIQQTSKDCDVHVSRVETSDIVFFKFKDLSKRYRMPLVDLHANPYLSELITLTWDAL